MRWWLSISLAKSLFFYSQLISSILRERGHKVSISEPSLSLAQISYCSLLTVLISDLFCSTSYRPIHWPSRISNSVIYVLAIFMWSASINLREKEREREVLPHRSPAWRHSNFSLRFSFLIILIMILLLAILDVSRNACPGKKNKRTPLLSFHRCSYCRPRGNIFLSGGVWDRMERSDPTVTVWSIKAIDFWESQRGRVGSGDTSFCLGFRTISLLWGNRALLPLLSGCWRLWSHPLEGAEPLLSFV